MLVCEISCGKDDWLYFIPTIKVTTTRKYFSIEVIILLWYIDLSFVKNES